MLSQTTVLSDWPHHKPCTIQLTTERLDTSSRLLALALLELELLLRKHPGFLSAWGHHGVCVCVAMKAPAGANCLGLKTVCPHTGVNYQGCWKWKRRCWTTWFFYLVATVLSNKHVKISSMEKKKSKLTCGSRLASFILTKLLWCPQFVVLIWNYGIILIQGSSS